MLGRYTRSPRNGGRVESAPGLRTRAAERAATILALCLIIGVPVLNWHKASRVEIPHTLGAFRVRMDERIPALMKEYSIPGVSIALIQDGKVTWTRAYGYADLARSRPMATDTILMAQSISKSVTAWGVMKLVEDGKVGLDDPVTRYIRRWRFPNSEFPVEKVTVKRLLSLSAGMPLGDFATVCAPGEPTPPVQETLSREDARLVRMPGSSFEYSNMSYALLELLVEEVTGRDFTEYMQHEILVPLGMDESSFEWREGFRDKVATGYDLQGRPVPAYVYPYHASGGLFSTVGDLARFVSAGMIGPDRPASRVVLKSESVKQLYSPNVQIPGMFGVVSDAYGLGHFLETLPGGRLAAWHGGQGNGWMTHFHSVPETGDGIVILTNSQRSWPFFSSVLRDWAKWSGFSSVGMGNIIRAEDVMKIIVGLLQFTAVWQAWRLIRGAAAGKRRFAPFAGGPRLARIGQVGLAAALVGLVVWSAGQEYLFIFSIFPTLCNRLGTALLGVAALLLASACLPESGAQPLGPDGSAPPLEPLSTLPGTPLQ